MLNYYSIKHCFDWLY